MTVHVTIVTLDHAALMLSVISLRVPPGTSCVYTGNNDGSNRFVLMRAFQRLSYRNFVKILQNFDIISENPAVASDFAAAGRFLTPFLTDLFGKNCSDDAK
jgi:hypothetical protein